MAGFAVESLPLQVYPALYRDLTESPEAVAAFFPLAPGDRGAWERRAAVLRAEWSDEQALARRRALAAALAAHHRELGAHPAQERNLAALGQPETLVVVTGQQAGLLGGPLYTAYKALGAVIRAAEASRHLGCPVVPVFWVASEDHDWSEVSHAQFAGPDGALHRLALEGSGGFQSAGDIPLPPEARRLVGQLTTLFPPSPEGQSVADALLAGLRRSGRQTLAGWFTWQLHSLLAATGLLFYDPMQPRLRELAAPVFAGAAERAPAANRIIAAAAERLVAAGYAPGLDIDADHLHLFVYHEGRRLALHADGERIHTRDGAVELHRRTLVERARVQPTAFSPNVALRPIVQDFTLPVLCQLGGPGEVAYLAQLTEVFPLWDREAPLVAPRPGATVVLPEDAAALAEAGARPEELRGDLGAVVDRAAAARSPVDVDALFAEERQALDARYARLRTALAEVAPALPRIVDGNLDRMRYQLDYLARKSRQHRRRVQNDLTSAIRAAAGRLYPGGAPQERSSVIYPYLFRNGPTFLSSLEQALAQAPGPFGRHWLLTWSD